MKKEIENKLKKIGIFDLQKALEFEITQQEVSRLVKEGKLRRVSRGLYLHVDAKVDQTIDFAIACKKFGNGCAIGGLSALFHYNLIEQVPTQTWVIVGTEVTTLEKNYRLMRTKIDSKIGTVIHKDYRIASIERAVIEGLKLATKIGERVAIKAAKNAILEKRTTLSKISAMAKELGLEKVLTKYFEVIVA